MSTWGSPQKRLTKANLAEAEKDWRRLNDPSGFNLCFNDNYLGAAMRRKWADWSTLGERIKAMKAEMQTEAESQAGAGI